MPRVHTQRAAKDYPNAGIKKGDTYYSWSFRYGGKRMSKIMPRPSQLTQSKMSAAYAAQEALEDSINGAIKDGQPCFGQADSPEDLAAALNDAAQSIRDVAQEYRDAMENMAVQGGSVYEECEQKADGLEEWADALESDASEIEGMDFTEYVDEEEVVDGKKGDEREVKEFDDLTEAERSSAMDAAREIAGNNSDCPL